jgi:hypothetical protein
VAVDDRNPSRPLRATAAVTRLVLRAVLVGSVASAGLACTHRQSSPPPDKARAVGRAGASRAAGASDQGPLLANYSVAYDGHGELRVEAELAAVGSRFAVERGAEPFVRDFETTGASGGKWTAGAREGRSFVAPPCGRGRCRVRYRYALREAARKLDDLDVAIEENEVLEAPPSTWLLAPADADGSARVRFRVTTADKTSFVSGVFRARDASNTWDIALGDLWTAPYSAFGPLRVRPLDVGSEANPARINLAIAPGKLSFGDDEIVAWLRDATRAIVAYFGRFPLPEALVLLVPARGRWIGEGKTLSGGGGAIFMRIGERAPLQALRDDWVLVHEMTHLTFPSVAREHDWAEEGLATYVEPFARARAGTMTPEAAWRSLLDGLPNGLPAAGDRGLDRTPTWGRTYWGGALFYLLADIEIRKATKNQLGLEHALRGILDAGGNNAHRWAVDEAFAVGDRATGTSVLGDLHGRMGISPHPVDLEDLWRSLGVARVGRGVVRFDDEAPLAAIRRAITSGR